MEYKLSHSSVARIPQEFLQARIPEWIANPSPPGDIPNPGIKPTSPVASALLVDCLLLNHWGSLFITLLIVNKCILLKLIQMEVQIEKD